MGCCAHTFLSQVHGASQRHRAAFQGSPLRAERFILPSINPVCGFSAACTGLVRVLEAEAAASPRCVGAPRTALGRASLGAEEPPDASSPLMLEGPGAPGGDGKWCLSCFNAAEGCQRLPFAWGQAPSKKPPLAPRSLL